MDNQTTNRTTPSGSISPVVGPAVVGPAPVSAYAVGTAGVPAAQPARRGANPLLWIVSGVIAALVLCVGFALLTGWVTLAGILGQITTVQVGDLQTASESVPLGSAQSVNVALTMGAGELTVSGDASQLMNATFNYNVAEWKPQVKYSESGSVGTLSITQPNSDEFDRAATNARNEWQVRLKSDVPITLDAKMGAGLGTLNLGGLNLTKLSLQTGASESRVDFSGEWKQNLTANIEGGLGNTTVRLPEGVGVRVTAEGGLSNISASGLTRNGNTYTNAMYGKSPFTLDIEVHVGVGNITLESVK